MVEPQAAARDLYSVSIPVLMGWAVFGQWTIRGFIAISLPCRRERYRSLGHRRLWAKSLGQ
jgi:hypothetical protein